MAATNPHESRAAVTAPYTTLADSTRRPPAGASATLDLVARHGDIHERETLKRLHTLARGAVVEIEPPGPSRESVERAAQQTVSALDAQVDAIYQGALLVNGFVGYADFLVSIDLTTGEPLLDPEGTRRRYEPVDAKLARSAKPAALLQSACYADALVRLGHPEPSQVHLWLGSGAVESVAAADLLPLVGEYRHRVLTRLAADPLPPVPAWGDARTACTPCSWRTHCEDGRREARDLSLVAGIRRDQVHRLRGQGVTTLDELADAARDARPQGMGSGTFHRLRAQSALQVAGAGLDVPLVDVFDLAILDRLPARDTGDLYYDIEGDPFAEGGAGLEYLHGVTDAQGIFTPEWAHARPQEKVAFEAIVDRFTAAAADSPGMHVYHYAPYERTALLALAVRHGTREAEVDQLLRDSRLVDLYGVVRQSMRASTESYSIKKLEPLYMGDDLRTGDVTNAGDSIVEYERYAAMVADGEHGGADEVLTQIEDYNAYDCESTRRLHRWLLEQAGRDDEPTVGAALGAALADADIAATAPEMVGAALAAALRDGVPDAADQRTPTEHARALLAAGLGYYARERKPFWWEHFEHLRTSLDEMPDEVVVLDYVEAGEWHTPPRAKALRRTIDASTSSSEHDVRSLGRSPFAVYDAPLPDGMEPSADSARSCHARTEAVEGAVTFTERAATTAPGWDQLPVALLPGEPPKTKGQEAVVITLAEQVLAGESPDAAWWRLLTREAPARPLPSSDGDVIDPGVVVAALKAMDREVLAVQGPPGTGKTYLGSHVIASLASRGWRIGVVAQSHKVIENLLERVCALDPALSVAKEPRSPNGASDVGGDADRPPWQTPKPLDAWMAQATGGFVVGGTSFVFARPKVREHHLDLMVVEEAGQFALVDAVVAGSAADKVLLLGDPQQLPQVCIGTHPEPVDVSALRHALGGEALVGRGQGYLLATTWRMHPEVCAPVSRLSYEGALTAHPRCAARSLEGVGPGIHLVEVDHRDNRTGAPEEAVAVVAAVENLLGRAWIDEDGPVRPLAADGILVVAPFNRQVALLRAGLSAAGHTGVQVGTVDKFQGREAPVVLVSMATSSGEDLPRGLEFLLSRNRLNVALSRAKWAAYLVHSPELRRITPTSPAALVALGAFVGLLRARAGADGHR